MHKTKCLILMRIKNNKLTYLYFLIIIMILVLLIILHSTIIYYLF